MSSPPEKRVSQSEIAKLAGCSQALVSMALNGRTKGISQSTYTKIREIASQNGYTPRGMKIEHAPATHHKTVGYILRSPLHLANTSNFFSHVHKGLHDHLGTVNIKTSYLGSEDDFSDEPKELLSRVNESIHGVAVMGQVDPQLLNALRDLGKPLVYISARESGICHSVTSNEIDSAEDLVDHLYALGHRNFAWIGGGSPSRRDARLKALQSSLKKRDLALDSRSTISMKEADRNDGYEAAAQIVSAAGAITDLPTAWISFNALMARGAMSCLFRNGVRIPQDVSVAAYDMTRVCEEEQPSITSAGADPEKMGVEAARVLLRSIERAEESLCDLTVPATFTVRATTGAAQFKQCAAG